MSYHHRRILCGYLLTVIFGSAWAIAQDQPAKDQPPKPPKAQPAKDQPPKVQPAEDQPAKDEPAVKITPSGETTRSEPAAADTDRPFQPIPSASGAVSAVSRLLAQNKDYEKGDLLTWELVKPVLDRLRRAKVPMPPEKELKTKFLSENDSLVKMLGTERGKVFFKELSKNPPSIDMVDHYRRLPYGDQFLKEFIRDVDGYKFFTTKTWMDEDDAKWAERWTLANVPGGKKFGQPTGRIYTESQLIDFLANYKKSGKARSYE